MIPFDNLVDSTFSLFYLYGVFKNDLNIRIRELEINLASEQGIY